MGLEDRILTTNKKSPAAQNRFIYYPDHLVRLPGPGSNIFKNIATIAREPLFAGALSETLSEITRPRRPESLSDESIGSFISRRFGGTIADNVVSAVFHGIYAGDIYNLSARSILPSLWHTEWRHCSIVKGMLDQLFGGLRPASNEDFDTLRDPANPLGDVEHDPMEEVRKASVFTFKGGLGELGDRLEQRLGDRENVLVYKDTEVNDLKLQFHTEGSRVGNLTCFSYTQKSYRLYYYSREDSSCVSCID